MAKKQNSKKRKLIRINFGFSWFYLILIIGIIYMLVTKSAPNPQKVEWADVETMINAGDVKEIHFVRNDFKGDVTIRPERLAKYSEQFGGQVPEKSPHFVFMVSNKFNPEETFGELNTALPIDSHFKVIMENNEKIWGEVLQWLLFQRNRQEYWRRGRWPRRSLQCGEVNRQVG